MSDKFGGCQRLPIPHTPRPPFAGMFPAQSTVAVELGDLAGGHAGGQDVAVGQAGGAKDALIVETHVGLAGGIDFADLALADHVSHQVAAVGLGLNTAPAAVLANRE